MLRKRSRSHHNDQHMNHYLPGLFVGFNPRSSDTDSVRSPTSPLDFRIFSSFGNPFRQPISQNEHKRWNRGKVGLSIIDSLDDETKEPGKVIQLFFDKKNILLERQMSVRSLDFGSRVNSLEAPKNIPVFKPDCADKGSSHVLFEIGKHPFEPGPENENFIARSMDTGNYGSYLTHLENTKNLMPLESESLKLERTSYIGPVPVSEIEHCEDYTCVRTHGPNPKVTHILGDYVLECHNDEVTVFLEKTEVDDKIPEAGGLSDYVLASYPSNSFLKSCYSCEKELDGEDIYIYRGEKAFCSYTCRSQEIEFEEEMEKTNNDSSDESSNSSEITSKSGLFIAT